ncbi:serine/threonine protein kinase [Aliidongia dinghuensis]|uniref:Serine/threonine protein kinase n=1 Tax=Aliidongia dinghuensis TaxID=1867774 RepID=A0A8J2Z1Y3_9PROT|nr:diguanylate cyclase [Aliidongia dinghuensis]GGF48040.1 serine/threonine protein kinase [Aliidongia dinghuensis]
MEATSIARDDKPFAAGITLGAFRILGLAQDEPHAYWYRATRLADGQPVVLYLPHQMRRPVLERQRALLAPIADPAIDRMLDLTELAGRPAMVLAHDGHAAFLSELCGTPIGDLDRFLTIAIGLADALARLHEREIVHRDVRPANVRYAPETGSVRLAGFSLAAELHRAGAVDPSAPLHGDLPYMSPEQTGRTNRPVDWRSDLYSLGVLFHELLTGATPFQAHDPIGWVHCHIARQPAPVTASRPDLPPMLASIVLKLLAKSVEQRYQSAAGLKADLEEFRVRLAADNGEAGFPLERHQRRRELVLPHRLYGRDADVGELLDAFERARAGNAELLLVTGPSGIGKSALVHEVLKPITRERGYFAQGKFDQYRHDTPYAAVIDALRTLVRSRLTEGPVRVRRWREATLQALGANAALVTDVIPELARTLGPTIVPAPVPPSEAKNRFHNAVTRLVQTLASDEHPVALVLDDLQWADSASVELLAGLLTDPDSRHFLVIGAYRDNEILAEGPLARGVRRIEAAARVTRLDLAPLTRDEIATYLADALQEDRPDLLPLAEILAARSEGNPFFLGQLLLSLAQAGSIRRELGVDGWVIDRAAILRQAATDPLADLLARRLDQLPPATASALGQAAAIGNRFALTTLAALCDQTEEATAAELVPALRAGLLIALDDGDKAPVLQFAHDRLQQAAYRLVPEGERPTVHLKLGRLLRGLAPAPEDPGFFDAVGHLNIARVLISDPTEREALSRLNVAAADRARSAAAFDAVLRSLTVALELLGGEPFDRAFALRLHLEASEAARLEQQEALSERLIAEARRFVASAHDEAAVLEMVTENRVVLGDLAGSVASALEALALLGLPLSERFAKLRLLPAIAKLKLTFWRRPIEQLADLPAMTDPRARLAMRIISACSVPAYVLGADVWPLLILLQTELSIRYGLAPATPHSFSSCAVVLCVVGDVEAGTRLGRLALELGPRLGALKQDFVFAFNTHHWKHRVADSLVPLRRSCIALHEAGDYNFAEYAAWAEITHLLYAGADLAGADNFRAEILPRIRRRGSPFGNGGVDMVLFFIDALRSEHLEIDVGAQDFGAPIEDRTELSGLHRAYFLVARCMLRLVFGATGAALADAAALEPLRNTLLSTVAFTIAPFYEALAVLGELDRMPAQARRRGLRRVRSVLRRQRRWARLSPGDHDHRVFLIEAELARVAGRHDRAAGLYLAALERAAAAGFQMDCGLIAEAAARLHRALGRDLRADRYLIEAHGYYRAWGARAKCQQLATQHPTLFRPGPGEAAARPAARPGALSGAFGADALDAATAIKLAAAVSSELLLEPLVVRLLDLAMENAGARFAALILADGGELTVPAEHRVDGDERLFILDRPLAETDLPAAVVHYVTHTGETVVLEDAGASLQFGNSARWADGVPRSVLCLPITDRGRLTGALYLENDLATGAFTQERVELLRVLAGQAAIAIANARLFTELDETRAALKRSNEALENSNRELERKVAERTSDLEASLQRLEEANVELERLANHDMLTGLFTRRRFFEAAELEQARARRTNHTGSIFVADLDHFKRINDTYGHAAGDAALRAVAQCLKASLRSVDIAGRLGGEELIALLPETALADAACVAERFRVMLERTVIRHEDLSFSVTTSVGVASWSGADEEIARVMARADTALYRVKHEGRNAIAVGTAPIQRSERPEAEPAVD